MNEESKKFISWAKVRMDDDGYYFALVSEVIQEALAYLHGSKAIYIAEIVEKLNRGAIEHGEPIYTKDQVSEELRHEFKDLVGWKLIDRWQDERKRGLFRKRQAKREA